jgi:Kef-type K+ transport system membrane component KefB
LHNVSPDTPILIIVISLIIFLSPLISKLIRLPIVAVEIILGSIAISFGIIQSSYTFELVAELGFLYLMFLAGLEVDLKDLLNISRNILKKGMLYLMSLYGLSILITIYLDVSKIFIAIFPLISLGLLAALKKEYGKTDWIELGITIGLLGEIVSILVLTMLSAMMKVGVGYEFYKTLILLGGFFIIMGIIYKLFHNLIWWYPEIKTYLMPKFDNLEQDIRLSMAIFFIMVALMLFLHLEVAFGAFIAGTFIATFFEHNKGLPKKLEHFGFGWLVPIFFISIGMQIDIDSLFLDGLVMTAFVIAFGMFFVRFVSSFVFYKDLKFKNTLLFAISHSMPLTLLIAIATLAYHNHSIDNFHYLSFILASILEVLIGMIAVNLIMRRDKSKR